MKIFTPYEIYELVSAENGAQEMQRESGYSCHYSENITNSDIEEKVDILDNNNKLNKFENLLSKAAKSCQPLFDELSNLNKNDFENQEDDFENEQEFFEAIREIKDEITDKACEILSAYCE